MKCFCKRVTRKIRRAHLDRFETMRASLSGLLSEDDKRTTVLERSEDSVVCNESRLPRL